MLRRKFTALMLMSMLGLATAARSAETVYSFGVVPQFEPRKLSATWTPILQEIEKRSGVHLKMVGPARIPEFEDEFQAGRYDFAYMNPYHGIMARVAQNYRPLVRDGDQKLFGVLVVAKDSPFSSVKDLDGTAIAFPAPNALGASLLMRADLDRIHHIRFEPVWAQTHSSAYLNVALGKVAAAGGIMSTFKQQPQAVQDKLRILYETRRVAPHPVVVHPRIPADVAARVRQAFLDMGATPEGAALLAQVPISRIAPASAEDYAELAGWGLEKYYEKGAD